MELNKVKSYIGFAIKSKSIVIGTDLILKSKNVALILCESELSSSSYNTLETYANQRKIQIFKLKNEDFFEICPKNGVKVLGVTNKSLADAIINNLTNID